MATATRKKKRNAPDATLRNTRAGNTRDDRHDRKIAGLARSIRDLDRRVKQLEAEAEPRHNDPVDS